jgi:hypothetical protein
MERRLAGLAVVVAATFVLGSSAWATGQSPAGGSEDAGLGVPQTAEEHAARAAAYREKAAVYRREAEVHRKMFADYKAKQGPSGLQSKLGHELPWIAKMRKHCDAYMKQAERMAAEAESFAQFHHMRSEEMKGK